MSMYENEKDRHSPESYSGNITHSKSFVGLSHRRTASASDVFSTTCLDGIIASETPDRCGKTHSRVTGHNSSSKATRSLIQGLSATWSGKPPKAPRPERTQLIFDAVRRGLRESIDLAQGDLSNLRAAVDNVSITSSYQTKAAERYLKKLEFHLSKLEELKEQYDVQEKMRDGIRTMAYAYVLSNGKERGSALNCVHSQYKECNDLLCSFESKLERMMGTLLFEMKGIQGFARICTGDVFEIIIKHGDQKWKSRGQIFKNNKQAWENRRILFKSLFNEPLFIKASEVRGLGKNILLGNKYCETRDLFSAHPQQMTVNLNPSGSLKLNLIITWNPLHGVTDETSVVPMKSFFVGSGSPHSHHKSASRTLNEPPDFMETVSAAANKELSKHTFYLPDEPEYDNESTSAATFDQSFAVANLNYEGTTTNSSDSVSVKSDSKFSNCNESLSSSVNQPRFIDSSCVLNTDFSNLQILSNTQSDHIVSSTDDNVQEILQYFISSLEDVHKHYPVLDELYHEVLEIEKLLKFQEKSLSGSDISISIESALGCFDFLNTAIDNDDFDFADERITNDKVVKTLDMGTNSYVIKNGELPASGAPNFQPLTCDVDQLDMTLITHIKYCLRLIKHLGSCNPLRYLTMFSLEKLRKQKFCFSTLLSLIRQRNKNNISSGAVFLENETELKNLWLKLVGVDDICSTACQILQEIEKIVRTMLSNTEACLDSKVSIQLICRMLDVSHFEPEAVLTVLQFRMFFIDCKCSLRSFIKQMASDEIILENLKSKEKSRIEIGISVLQKIFPDTEALFTISQLLLEDNIDLKNMAEGYLKDLSRNTSLKPKVVTTYLVGLESEEWQTRQGSCAALAILDAVDCVEQLAYVSFADENSVVQHEAKNALFNLGNEGRRLYKEYELQSDMFKASE